MNSAGATASSRPAGARRSRLAGPAGVALLGVLFLVVDGPLSGLSYDLAHLLRRPEVPPEAVLVLMDEASHRAERQPLLQPWDRRLHARLLRRLSSANPRAIVLDAYLPLPGDPAADAALIDAARESGRVAVAASVARDEEIGGRGAGLQPPFDALRAVVQWGPAEAPPGIVRERFPGIQGRPSLPVAAARLARSGTGTAPSQAGPVDAAEGGRNRYLRYYGPPGTFRSFSYSEVLAGRVPEAAFSNVVVLVGLAYKGPQLAGGRNTERVGGDNLPTPYRRFGDGLSTGVELLATAVVNELRGEFLGRPGPWTEVLGVLGLGWGMAAGLGRMPWRAAIGVAAGLAGVLALGGMVLPWSTGVWVPWLVPVAVQVPAALLWSLGSRRGVPLATVPPSPVPAAPSVPASPSRSQAETRRSGAHEADTREEAVPPVRSLAEHDLIRRIGRGGYGEVWLARDALGALRAIKVIDRQSFSDDRPFEREFEGIRRFRPLSLKHPGLVHVLHVGRDEARKRFHYVMEAADDASGGRDVDPDHYQPRTLEGDLKRRGTLSAAEAVTVGIGVGEALAFLHANGLVHRDVKPGNILYVDRRPKLADVGLVTAMAGSGRDVSQVGTMGYLPPEGAGTVQADVYALGMLLYVAVTGRVPKEFPRLPEGFESRADADGLRALNRVILRACEPDPGERYATLEAMLADLRPLATGGAGQAGG